MRFPGAGAGVVGGANVGAVDGACAGAVDGAAGGAGQEKGVGEGPDVPPIVITLPQMTTDEEPNKKVEEKVRNLNVLIILTSSRTYLKKLDCT